MKQRQQANSKYSRHGSRLRNYFSSTAIARWYRSYACFHLVDLGSADKSKGELPPTRKLSNTYVESRVWSRRMSHVTFQVEARHGCTAGRRRSNRTRAITFFYETTMKFPALSVLALASTASAFMPGYHRPFVPTRMTQIAMSTAAEAKETYEFTVGRRMQ